MFSLTQPHSRDPEGNHYKGVWKRRGDDTGSGHSSNQGLGIWDSEDERVLQKTAATKN